MAEMIMTASYCVHGAPYLPWTNLFRKISATDVFVVLDDVQMPMGRSLLNRCNVRINNKNQTVTVPIKRRSDARRLRCNVEIADDGVWRRKHIETFRHLYGRNDFWTTVSPEILNVIEADWKFLFDMNVELIRLIMARSGITANIIRSSQMHIEENDPTKRIVAIGKRLGADTYVSGLGAISYLSAEHFAKVGISVKYSKAVVISAERDGWTDHGITCLDELSRFGCLQGLSKRGEL